MSSKIDFLGSNHSWNAALHEIYAWNDAFYQSMKLCK